MIYKNFQNKKLSALGLGTMHLPTIEGNDANIDEAATKQMVAYAMEHGVNYYDTAWGYHGGNSESVIGGILSDYPRESYYLATKFPGYDVSNMGKVEQIFEEQLKKCKVEYFDFYLIHNVCERNIEQYLDKQYGTFEYLKAQKDAGRIKHLGFSAHGSYIVMKRFLEAYGEHMEFCQIQLNYLDWSLQKANEKMELLKQFNIPVWSMEPLRGGKLADLPENDKAKLETLRAGESPCAWAFRFLQTLPDVTVVLSGASNIKQLQENIQIFEEDAPLNEQEFEALLNIANSITQALPCTACRYCLEYCPQKLDIPHLISLYNEHRYSKDGFLVPMALSILAEDKRPAACAGCKACEAVCPQQIKISEAMADFEKRLQA